MTPGRATGATVVVGAFGDDDNGTNSGSAYVFQQPGAVFLSIDEDSIDNGTNCSNAFDVIPPSCISIEECAFGACAGVAGPPINNDPSVLVGDDNASIPGAGGTCPNILPINGIAGSAVSGPLITLPSGQVGDEGLFSPAPTAFVGLPGGLPGYIGCSAAQDENFLDGVVRAPLNAAAIFALEGRLVCAVVHDSDISDLGGGWLNLKGARQGRTAFEVVSVTAHPKGGDLLPVLEVDFLDSTEVDAACECENLETIDGEPYDCATP